MVPQIPPQTYIGMSKYNFKTRFRNHKKSFENPKYRSSTTLSKYIWDLKEEETNYEIKWSIVKRVRAYKSGDAQCHLCLQEKLFILNTEKRREEFPSCWPNAGTETNFMQLTTNHPESDYFNYPMIGSES